MEPSFRHAVPADKPRILEIAAQMWEGDDYIPDVIDDWLKPGRSAEVIVATLDDRLVALARYDRTFPHYAWFEGLRTDPAFQNRGLARALTGHLIARARTDGAERIGLSTYFDNPGSQKVTAAYAFRPMASFAVCSADGAEVRSAAAASAEVERVSLAEAAAYMLASSTLRLGGGFLPHSWRFYPFARSPERALGYMAHILGIRRGGKLAALLCAGDATPHGPSAFSIDFVDGAAAAVEVLARHALHLAAGVRRVEAMVPVREGKAGVGLTVLTSAGLQPWNGGVPDVLVSELKLHPSAPL